jgi:Tfp pilus assembly protein PilV
MENDMTKNVKSGFSLIEIMVAILVLIVIVMGSAAMIYQTGGSVQKSGNSRVAAEIVNDVLERARIIGYGNLVGSSTNLIVNGIPFTVQTIVTSTNHPDPEMTSVGMEDVVTRITYGGFEISLESTVFNDLGIIE